MPSSVVKYLKAGRVSRVKRWLGTEQDDLIKRNPDLAANGAWMDEIRVSSKRHCYGDKTYLLHLAASIGDERVLRYLLKSGFGRRQGCLRQRGDKQTPLHLVVARCQRTLKARGGRGAIEDFQDYVKPILDACPAALKVKDQFGQSGSSVLEELQSDIAREEMGGGGGGEDGTVDDEDRETNRKERFRAEENLEEERRWREKLYDEHVFENEGGIFGKTTRADNYWQDGENDERARETFKEFAERIEREYCERYQRIRREKFGRKARKRLADKGAAASSSSSKLEGEIDLAKKKQYDEMKRVTRLKNQKLDYEKRWEMFFEINKEDRVFSFDELPWPKPLETKSAEDDGVSKKWVAEMLEISTFTVSDEDKERERKLEIKRWHPDKVMQKIKVKAEDADSVARAVKELAQALNSLKPK